MKKRRREDIRQAKANWGPEREDSGKNAMPLTKDFRETIRGSGTGRTRRRHCCPNKALMRGFLRSDSARLGNPA
jgi:hypothetical protein